NSPRLARRDMEISEILEAIRFNREGQFAEEAVRAAVEKRDEITPHLLGIIEEAIEHGDTLVQDEAYIAPIYALYLLAQFRGRRASPLIVRLFSMHEDVVDALAGDFVTEGLGRVLASVAGGDPSLIQQLVEDRDAFVWARVGAVEGIVAMVGAGT